MGETVPLREIQNDSLPIRPNKKTYGKNIKHTTISKSAKAIFTTPEDLEAQFAKVTINEQQEDVDRESVEQRAKSKNQTKTSSSTIEIVATSIPDGEPTAETFEAKIAIKTRTQRHPKRTKQKNKGTEIETNTSSVQDHQILNEFVHQYSDRNVLSFQDYGNTISKRYDVRKIGEGTYSSVFALTRKQVREDSTPADENLYRTTILKMMPILLPSQGNVDGMTAPSHIANELQTMKVMDPIHGFVRYRGLLVVRGKWPKTFLDAFRDFRKQNRRKAENEDPETAFGEEQHYALIEMEDAGMEISDIKRPSDFQIYDIFWQTAIHLANAELVCGFEHRDLHVSNICVKADEAAKGEEDARTDVAETVVRTMIQQPRKLLGMSNIAVTIIDYTFSRVELPESIATVNPTSFRAMWQDDIEYDKILEKMAQEARPAKSGDEFEEKLQSLTYAKVAKCVAVADKAAKQERGSCDQHLAPWEQHVPRTNVAWLGYLISCLLGRAGKTVKTRYVAESSVVAKTVQDAIRKKLLEIRDMLMEVDVESEKWPESATDLVRIGVERSWLNMAEIEEFKKRLERDS